MLAKSFNWGLQTRDWNPELRIHDGFGNIVTLLDMSGNCIETYRYSAFGEIQVFNEGIVVDNPWRFSSKRVDDETGFIYFGRRYYAVDIGRWITPDPAGFEDGPDLYDFLLAPMLISMVAEYCLLAVTVYLSQCSGGAAAAAILTGALQVNGNVLEPIAFAGADMTTYLCDRAGACFGTILSLSPGKICSNATKAGVNMLGKEIDSVASKVIQKETKQVITSYSKTVTKNAANETTCKTGQYAEKQFLSKAPRPDFIVGHNGIAIPTNRNVLESGFKNAGFPSASHKRNLTPVLLSCQKESPHKPRAF